ncbi:MAG: ClpXP protease specificity-enhancing factor SspB [Alphaproteobacteria bacterium]|nr:ClpXP protease specificity-enhancing factor SspB [Alphaproteobacteria bacterium]
MTEDLLGYNEMVETAMRSVVRQALERAGSEGLPGEHHFYITFRTDHPDTDIPARLKERYPEEMTIVLQHQFWNLVTSSSDFAVDLSFNHKMETLRIPYDALITFADPSVNFGLQFHVDLDDDSWASDDLDVASDMDDDLDLEALEKGDDPRELVADTSGGDKEDGDNVVTLDSFRKDKK